MQNVRIGIVGLGIMGSTHADNILNGRVKRCELAAVCDTLPANLARYEGLKTFKDPHAMIVSGEIDAIMIATPHYAHTTIGIDALKNGLHVMIEKPISVHKADAAKLIAAHRNKKQVFAAMFNMRGFPIIRRMKQLIENGEIGRLIRVQWTITDWFRTQNYYDCGNWRGTWSGEGGGVLINQCPHQLDIMQWLVGMPSKIWGFAHFGARHDIEVEDEVTAYMEYANGATGVFTTSTGEAPGTNRLEIAGTRGKLVFENNRLVFNRNEIPCDEFCRASLDKFTKPPIWNIEIPTGEITGEHAFLTQNFVDAVLDGVPLYAPAEEGINSVEIANAIIYSSVTGKPVKLPLDGKAYERILKKLINCSKGSRPKDKHSLNQSTA